MSDLFYRNRRLLVLTLALVAAAGVSSYIALPLSEDPELTKRHSLLVTAYPGAGAEEVEALVTRKLEKRLEEVEEIKKLESVSQAGLSAVQIELLDRIGPDEGALAWSRIRDKVSDTRPELPPEAAAPEFNDTDTEVDAYTITVGLTVDAPGSWTRIHDIYHSGIDYPILRRTGEELADHLRAVGGAKHVKLFGDPSEEILVRVRPETLAERGLTADSLASTIALGNSRAPAGQLRGSRNDVLFEVEGELDSLGRVASTPVLSGADGRMVRVQDIADVEKTVADPPAELAIIGGRPGIAVAVRMQRGYRIDAWAAQARAAIEDFRTRLPANIRMEILFDQSRYVADRMGELQRNLLFAAALVMLIVWFAMGWRSALLIGSALPISVLLAVTGMRLFGLPIDQMSVTGLIVALGLLIDNGIVMVDEVRRRLTDGSPRREAVSASVRYLAVPLMSSTLTTIFAFAPIALVPGSAGEFIGPIAISVILALLASLLAALTIVPALAGIFAGAEHGGGSWQRDGFSDPELGRRYQGVLRAAFQHPRRTIFCVAAPALLGFFLLPTLKEQFFPPADRDQFQVQLRLPQQASIEETLAYAHAARERLIAYDEIDEVHWFVGHNVPRFYYNMFAINEGSPFFAHAMVSLRDNDGYFRLIRCVQKDLDNALPGAQFLALQLEQGPPFQAPIELHISGPDLDTLRDLGEQARVILSRTAGVTHTLTSMAAGRPKLHISVDDEELRLAGLDNLSAANQLAAALDGAVGGSLIEGTEEAPVRVLLDTEARGDYARIASLELIAPSTPTRSVSIADIGRVELRPETSAIARRFGERANTVRGYIQSGLLPAVVLEDFRQRLEGDGFRVPVGYSVSFGGEAEQRDTAVGNLLANVSLLALAMVATLVLSFNSFRLAAVIGAVAILSVGFAFLMLFVFNYPFGFVAIVGSMGLIGVSVNDAIVVLAALRKDGRVTAGSLDALVETVEKSTRHVATTTVTTMAGFTPLIISGGDFWPPLAIAIGAGVFGATFLAIFLAPAAYRMLVMRRLNTAPAQGVVA